MRWKTLTAAVATFGLIGAPAVAQAQGIEETAREPAQHDTARPGTAGQPSSVKDSADGAPGQRLEDPGVAPPTDLPVGLPDMGQAGAGMGASEQGDSQLREVQQTLKDQGLYTGGIDGIDGPLTKGAIRQFQQSHGLPVTGQVDASTLDRLGVSGSTQEGSQP